MVSTSTGGESQHDAHYDVTNRQGQSALILDGRDGTLLMESMLPPDGVNRLALDVMQFIRHSSKKPAKWGVTVLACDERSLYLLSDLVLAGCNSGARFVVVFGVGGVYALAHGFGRVALRDHTGGNFAGCDRSHGQNAFGPHNYARRY